MTDDELEQNKIPLRKIAASDVVQIKEVCSARCKSLSYKKMFIDITIIMLNSFVCIWMIARFFQGHTESWDAIYTIYIGTMSVVIILVTFLSGIPNFILCLTDTQDLLISIANKDIDTNDENSVYQFVFDTERIISKFAVAKCLRTSGIQLLSLLANDLFFVETLCMRDTGDGVEGSVFTNIMEKHAENEKELAIFLSGFSLFLNESGHADLFKETD